MRRVTFQRCIPKTQQFLLAIYGSHINYMSYDDPTQNPYAFLEDICMMYDHSFETEFLAKRALEMLHLEEPFGCSGTCRVRCKYRCLGQCGMDTRARLHDELMKITSSPEKIKKYLLDVDKQ